MNPWETPTHPTHARTQPVPLSYFLKWSVFAGRRWTNTTGGLRMGTKRKWAEKTKWVENHWKCTLVIEALSNKICELTRTTGKKNRSKCGVWKSTTISGYATISTNMSHLVAVTGAGTGNYCVGQVSFYLNLSPTAWSNFTSKHLISLAVCCSALYLDCS